jgi:hypothetical protein
MPSRESFCPCLGSFANGVDRHKSRRGPLIDTIYVTVRVIVTHDNRRCFEVGLAFAHSLDSRRVRTSSKSEGAQQT